MLEETLELPLSFVIQSAIRWMDNVSGKLAYYSVMVIMYLYCIQVRLLLIPVQLMKCHVTQWSSHDTVMSSYLTVHCHFLCVTLFLVFVLLQFVMYDMIASSYIGCFYHNNIINSEMK